MRSLFIFRIVLLPLFAAPLVLAQESVDYASISGRVTDPSGAIVEGARVTARQTETNLTSAATTDHEGRFRFPYLRVGQYEINTHRDGFAEWTRTLTVTLGAAFELPVSLSVASLVTYYVLFFLHLETRRVGLAGNTRHPTEEWMTQMARNAVDEESGYLRCHRYGAARPRCEVLR